MSDFDMLMSDWLGDTLGNVLLFNFVLFGPAAFATGQGVAITWRSLRQLVLYSALLSLGLRFFDYALAGGELWSIGGFFPGLGCAIRHRRLCVPADARASDGPAISLALRAQRLAGLGGAALSSTHISTVVEGKPWETLYE